MSRLRLSTPSVAFTAAILYLLLSALPASAVVIYDEATDGDLPDDPNAAPLLVLSLGLNTVQGEVGGPGDGRDGVRLQVPENKKLDEFVLVFPDPILEPFELQFVVRRLGFASISTWSYGTLEIVPPPPLDIFVTPPTSGPPVSELPQGEYGVILKTAEDPVYMINMTLSAIPEPTTAVLALAALCLAIGGRRAT